ncbi:MAG: 30S ribosomal protein THX, partial [Bacteroidales bacterium]|nr:30S ribosomal protein THX [Bacteroidales bacterium]
MGKGDKKTKRGKIILGTYGVRRLRKRKKNVFVPKKEVELKEKAEELKPEAYTQKSIQEKTVAESKLKTTAKKTSSKKAEETVIVQKSKAETKPKA